MAEAVYQETVLLPTLKNLELEISLSNPSDEEIFSSPLDIVYSGEDLSDDAPSWISFRTLKNDTLTMDVETERALENMGRRTITLTMTNGLQKTIYTIKLRIKETLVDFSFVTNIDDEETKNLVA